MNIKQQIEQVLKSTDRNDLNFPTTGTTQSLTSMTDIQHGHVYTHVIHSLQHERSRVFITLTCNTDDIAVYTSSEQTMWTFTARINEFANLLDTLNLHQLVGEATRPKSRTYLDLIITSNLNSIHIVSVLPPLCRKCDHSVVQCIFNSKMYQSGHATRTIYNYNAVDWGYYCYQISQQLRKNPNVYMFGVSVDARYQALCYCILKAAELAIPSKVITLHQRDKPWFTESLRCLYRRRNRLYRTYKHIQNTKHYALYRSASKIFFTQCEDEKKAYFAKLNNIQVNNKNWWKLLKASMGRRATVNIPSLLNPQSQWVHGNLSKANLMNSYFASVCFMSSIDENRTFNYPLHTSTASIENISVSDYWWYQHFQGLLSWYYMQNAA
ncbi:unnamed protein product [Didymodactylos carnosus]|uniref:Uncharacterized protein n=1 Tax=Didymodactylos carnosus TaxID=1234261 RepID=A0A8S2VUW0_9BILA|nr:unnamed protein product [Didymodactylos carnosus]CAF4391800.1 unnamed protein product [Didymodactylos carnosus]